VEPEIQQIIHIEDRRTACDSLQVYLTSPDDGFRARAVAAIGRLQDGRCLDNVIKMLDDASDYVRIEAAFALGQIGQSAAEKPLIDVIHSNELIEVKVRAVEALGKVGAERSIPVRSNLLKNDNSALRAEAALSAGRMALRNISHPILTDALFIALGDQSSEVRWKSCYSLMRIGKDLSIEKLRDATRDTDPRVRMYAAQALGNTQHPAIIETLGQLLRHDPDWRVRVKAANGLGTYPLRRIANYVDFKNQQTHVRVCLIQTVGSSAQQDSAGYIPSSREHNLARHQLEQILAQKFETQRVDETPPLWTPAEVGLALISYAQLMGEDAAPRIADFIDYPHPRVRARAMQALGETKSSQALRIYESVYTEAPPVVKIAILEAIAKFDDYPEPTIFLQALRENDEVLVALAALGLSKDSLNSKIYTQSIITAYQNLPKPLDVEAAQMIFTAFEKIGDSLAVPVLLEALNTPDKALSKAAADALQKLTGQDYSSQIASHTQPHSQFSYSDIYDLKGARAFIKTNRGDIEILFHTYDAPLTVLNFVRLAEKGFFDRLTFHRVVPNFVIQGGDPRGDSWGSPGYAIRSEFNKRRFIRGSVGMASAGKDTEGCQFFITHSEQPHLDGRYTVFGQVVSGMDVVDAIQEGDEMELVTIRR
jgi:cyclophilin family peptidyl-prolyl cis-trans isomerase/HEAT repeat protein